MHLTRVIDVRQVTGSVGIQLNISSPTPCIVLHAAHMDIHSVTLEVPVTRENMTGTLTIALEDPPSGYWTALKSTCRRAFFLNAAKSFEEVSGTSVHNKRD